MKKQMDKRKVEKRRRKNETGQNETEKAKGREKCLFSLGPSGGGRGQARIPLTL
jgi:hypothetical protein